MHNHAIGVSVQWLCGQIGGVPVLSYRSRQMAEIYDNIEAKFLDGLKGIIQNKHKIVQRVDFCVGYFNLRGWRHIADEIDALEGDDVREEDTSGRLNTHHRVCRLLIGMYKSPKDLIAEEFASYETKNPDGSYKVGRDYREECKYQITEDFCKQLEIGVPASDAKIGLEKLIQQLKDGKVVVKLYLRHQLHAKLYIAHRDDKTKIHAIMGSSNLTQGGFNSNGELNALFEDSDHAEKLDKWFNDRWNDRFNIDITKELIEILEKSWATPQAIPPYYIYLKTAYHLSEDARAGFNEYSIPHEFENVLFEFQATAVKLAARKLDRQGGAMIGDVVGLGKTMTACAIAKLYENIHDSSTLILCPANLQKMWQDHINRYNLKADVLSIDRRVDPESMRPYKLCIIDESHNLRNSEGKRYKRIRDFLEKKNSRVLLLTATAYNKSYYDISSQLKLFISNDQDLGIRPENYIKSIGGEHEFAKRHSNISVQSIQAFEKSNDTEDWFNLMKHFLVRRTRTFIKNNYAKKDHTNGRYYLQYPNGESMYFPERIPHSIKFSVKENSQYAKLYSEQMLALIDELKLPRYGLSQYIDDKKTSNVESYIKQTLANLSKAGKRMMGFCLSTFGKRMDSCGYAYLLTLKRHLLRNLVYLYAIETKNSLPIGDTNDIGKFYDETMDDEDGENNEQSVSLDSARSLEDFNAIANTYYTNLSNSNTANIDWLDSAYFKPSLKKHLKEDINVLLKILELCGEWDASQDPKVDELYHLLTHKHVQDKVLVFTQYADTAEYLCRELQRRKLKDVARVTGNSDNISELVYRFSPKSNPQFAKSDSSSRGDVRVLIATDVLSEGQNLQDAHVILNFDMPWAIIRLIQRAGRVDRIGQASETIDCYSFFPADGIEKVIRLRDRLRARIIEMAGVLGSDEEFFEGNEINIRDLYNEKAGTLDDNDADIDVDTASMAYQIWKSAIEANPKLEAIIKNMRNVCSATKTAKNAQNSVITYARTYHNFDVLTWMSENTIQTPDGRVQYEILSQSQNTILKALACSIDEPARDLLPLHYDIVKATVSHVREQSKGMRYAGALGNPNCPRARLHNLLDEAAKQHIGLFFTLERQRLVKSALDEIYQSPMLSAAQDIVQRMMRDKRPAEAIIDVTIDLYLRHQLCLSSDDRNKSKDPIILCSMGLRN